MKYLKLYEEKIEPQIGDYVFCIDRFKNNTDIKINKFLAKNVGQIIEIFTPKSEKGLYLNLKKNMYLIKYDNVTNKYKDEFGWHETEYRILHDRRGFFIDNILCYSPNKEKVEKYKEIYNIGKKYNL